MIASMYTTHHFSHYYIFLRFGGDMTAVRSPIFGRLSFSVDLEWQVAAVASTSGLDKIQETCLGKFKVNEKGTQDLRQVAGQVRQASLSHSYG